MLDQNVKPKIYNMKKNNAILLAALVFAFTLSSCAAIGGIFKAGVWVGVIVVVVVVALILWLVGRSR